MHFLPFFLGFPGEEQTLILIQNSKKTKKNKKKPKQNRSWTHFWEARRGGSPEVLSNVALTQICGAIERVHGEFGFLERRLASAGESLPTEKQTLKPMQY
ncbi:hypothetical protein CHARACLAT_010152 [Characodon lateralis]|uniref:Uncharacterized protein n=1 Tax=Characodon lateralis TaxID=208331 RepID=A0ABU7D8H3_9TELE|nr:hypothetical protein [Characodon lateralis]